MRDVLADAVKRILPSPVMWIDQIDFDTVELVPSESIDEAFRIRFRDLAGQDSERLHIILMMEFPWSVECWSKGEMSGSGSGLRSVLFRCGRPEIGLESCLKKTSGIPRPEFPVLRACPPALAAQC